MATGVSGRALAALVGLSEGAIRKAEKARRIARLPDGSYDADQCIQALQRNTDPGRRKAAEAASQPRTDAVRAPAQLVRTDEDAREAVALIARILREEGIAGGVVDFNSARTAETILKARERELKIAQRRRELVSLAQQREHVGRAFVGYRQAMQRLPSRHVPQMAAELGCDPGGLERLLDRAIATELDALSAPMVRA